MNQDQRTELILHCDDLGLAHGVNEAAFEAFEAGSITSASVMAPCRHFDEVVRYSRNHPGLDLGVHLTLTSEWPHYRWTSVADPARVPSLIAADGCLWSDPADVIRHATREDIICELDAQIARVLEAGIEPTHLDSHMFALLRSAALVEIYLAIGARFSLPILVPFYTPTDPYSAHRDRHLMPLDQYFAATPSWIASKWMECYLGCFDYLVPGINQIAVHLGRTDDEMNAILFSPQTQDWNAAWRQRDADVIGSERFRAKVVDSGVTLTTWRDVRQRQHQLRSSAPISNARSASSAGLS